MKRAAFFLLISLSGCSHPSSVELASANYGEKPPAPVEAARTFLTYGLFDASSAQINCSEPVQGYDRCSIFTDYMFGWHVQCAINGKNRFGGYAGFQPFRFFFVNSMIALGGHVGPFGLDQQWYGPACQ